MNASVGMISKIDGDIDANTADLKINGDTTISSSSVWNIKKQFNLTTLTSLISLGGTINGKDGTKSIVLRSLKHGVHLLGEINCATRSCNISISGANEDSSIT